MRFVRAFVRALIWPVRRFFDPRFQGLAHQGQALHEDLTRRLDAAEARADSLLGEVRARTDDLRAAQGELRTMLAAEMEASNEATTVLGRSLSDLLGEADRLRELLVEVEGAAIPESYVDRVVGAGLEELDDRLAKVLNFAASHRGFAAQRNLWFNPPLVLEHDDGDVRVSVVNERVAEGPYVMRALAALNPGASLLDVGAAESTLAFSLATLGFRVTALDLRPYPLKHPNLRSVAAPVQEWDTGETFDAVICLSTIEHIGLTAYGEAEPDEAADIAAMRRMRQLTVPGGVLVLTAPFGEKRQNEVQRTYDRAALDKLLDGWDVEDLTILTHVDSTTWVVGDVALSKSGEHVALATARRA